MLLGRDRESKIDGLKETLGACYNTFERSSVEVAIQLLESMTDEDYERIMLKSDKRMKNWIMETDSPNNMDHVIDMMIGLIKHVKNHTDPENMPQNIRITMKTWDEIEGDKEYVIEWE